MRIISNFFHKNEKWLTPAVLLGGFVLDNLTLRQADLLAENLVLAGYFLIIFIGTLLWHTYSAKRIKNGTTIETQSIIFLLMQFAFGGLFSSLTVFYVKSASLFASWPFILLLFGGMIATEYFKKHFTQFVVQLGTLYVLLFTYSIMLTPLLVRAINVWVFLLSGIISLVVIFGYIFLFQLFVPSLVKNKQKYLIQLIGGIYVLMHVFYFTNIIPPVPLTLRDTGVYQKVTKQGTDYIFSAFENKFSFRNLKQEYVVPAGSPVYFYSSIYAPVQFKQKIIHEWQRKDVQNNWVTIAKINFPIYGGNSGGYRGYSISNNVVNGEYRVVVKTENNQVLGRETFLIK